MAGSIIVDNINGYNISVGQVLCSAGQSLATNGYQKLSNGLIIQWGRTGATGTSTTVNFPIAFPTACFSVVFTGENNGSGAGVNFWFYSQPTLTGFIPLVSSGHYAHWFAIGY